jgi:hypothetical protein
MEEIAIWREREWKIGNIRLCEQNIKPNDDGSGISRVTVPDFEDDFRTQGAISLPSFFDSEI